MRRYIYIALLAAATASAQAQPPTVTARLEPDSVAIGDRFALDVTVNRDVIQMVDFPNFDDGKFTDQIEIAGEEPVDTLAKDGRRLTLLKRYWLTTFDEGEHTMGRFPVLYTDKNVVDTLFSGDSLRLRVGTFAIDTATMQLREVRPVLDAPFRVGEISLWVACGVAALALLAAVAWWLRRRLKRRAPLAEEPAPDDSPHLAAIKALEVLQGQKLWQNNRHKLYYTRLTDILRRYFEGRWGVAAMEMTSDEIVDAAREKGVVGVPMNSLKIILRSADLVKFAKHRPEAEENEAAWTQAYYFIEETKEI